MLLSIPPDFDELDWKLADETNEKMLEYDFDEIEDYVLVAGIPIDDMINRERCNRSGTGWMFDRLIALKKTLSESSEGQSGAA
jgi:hypothetical protein